METLIFLIGVTAMLVLLTLAAYVIGWLLTEVIRLPLDFKPFNCRGCLTFWFTVLLTFGFAWIVAPYFASRGLVLDRFTMLYGLTGVGVLLGLVSYQYIKIKFRVYE